MPSTFTNFLYHLIFSTKRREPLIHEALRDELYPYIGGIIRGEGGTLLAIGGMPDHVHLVCIFKSEPSVAEMLRRIKANSSKWVNQRPQQQTRFQWQEGYGGFTVSESQLEGVIRYVQSQQEHHRKMSFQEEFVEFLQKHAIEYDEQYLWE